MTAPLFDPGLPPGADNGIPPQIPGGPPLIAPPQIGAATQPVPGPKSPPVGDELHMVTPAQFVPMPGDELRHARNLPETELVSMLNSYLDEAREARQSGPDAREETWRRNQDAFWGHRDRSEKEEWQHHADLPQVANYVERRAASLSGLLVSGGDYHEVEDLLDPHRMISNLVHRIMKVILSRCVTTQTGHRVGFPRVLRDILKSGLLAYMYASVLPAKGGPRVEWVDPLEIFLDPSGRRLYRIRETEIDKHRLKAKKLEKHPDGKNVWNNAAIDRLITAVEPEQRWDKYRKQGHGNAEGNSFRKTYDIHEFLCTIVDRDGELIADNQLIVMGNRDTIIRGPEANPFWHGRDWIVGGPVISVPGSVYGRTDVENYRGAADTFLELTELLMDSVNTSSMNAFMIWAEALDDPSQIEKGVSPNSLWVADENWPAGQDFLKKVELGRIPAEAFQAWGAMKQELMEAAGQNELQLGGFAGKSGVTATETNRAAAGASTLDKARAADIEEGVIDPILDLLWWTTIQSFDVERDRELSSQLGPELSEMLSSQRADFRNRTFRFRSRAISSALERGERLQGLLGFLNVVGSSAPLAQIFIRDFSIKELIGFLLHDFGIDPDRLEKSEQEKIRDQMAQLQQGAAGGQGPPASPKTLNPSAPSAPGLGI